MSKANTLFKALQLRLSLAGFRAKRADFYEQLASALDAKEHIRDFIRAELVTAVDPSTRDASRAFALRMLASRMRGGDEHHVSRVLMSVMPKSDGLLLSSLDTAPSKSEVLRYVAAAVREQAAMSRLVKGKLLPPLFVLPGIAAMAYVMATRTIPIIVQTAPAEIWVGFNLFVRLFSEFIANWGALVLLLLVAAGTAFAIALPRWVGKTRLRLESVTPRTAVLLFPVCPILVPLAAYRDIQAGQVFAALAVLLQSGAKLKDALNTLARNSSPWLRWHLRGIVSHLEVAPNAYKDAFSKGLVSPQLLAKLASEIRTNPRFDQVLIRLGRDGLTQVRTQVDKQTSIINFYLLAGAGIAMLVLMLGSTAITTDMQDQFTPAKIAQRRLKQQTEMANQPQPVPAQKAPVAEF